VKNLLYGFAFVVCGDVTFATDLPRHITSRKEIYEFESKGEPENECSIDALKNVKKILHLSVGEDFHAVTAMKLFTKCKYFDLLDYYEDHWRQMNENNSHVFQELFVLLVQMMYFNEGYIGDYKNRIFQIIEHPELLTNDFFKHKALVFDMFFFAAVTNGRCGRSHPTEMCVHAAEWLQFTAYDDYSNEFILHHDPFELSEYPDNEGLNRDGVRQWGYVHWMAFGGASVEMDSLFALERVCPNLK
jgi:hypothetical protein